MDVVTVAAICGSIGTGGLVVCAAGSVIFWGILFCIFL